MGPRLSLGLGMRRTLLSGRDAGGRFSSRVTGSRKLRPQGRRDHEGVTVQHPLPTFDAQSHFSELLLRVFVPEVCGESLYGSA